METDDWLIYNGKFKQADTPLITARSRGLMYGDGCFETFRTYSGRCIALDRHLNRLKEGIRFLGIDFPDSLKKNSFRELLYELLKKNNLLRKDAVVRVQVWREGRRGYKTGGESTASFTIMAGAFDSGKPQPPVTLATAEIRRIPEQSLPSRYKLSNGINFIVAANQARTKGADDALMLTLSGHISETTISNIFWMKEQVIYTPSEACDLLPGITREQLISLLKNDSACNVEEGKYDRKALATAEVVWVCNSVRELVPVRQVDEHTFEVNHPVFDDIRKRFTEYRAHNLSSLV